MGSILTNNAALVALQTLSGINRNLNEVQDQISTGLAIGSASDDAAIFAISQVARSDVAGFEAIQGSLDLGASSLAVAANATDTISDILNDVRGLVVQAGEAGFDPGTIQNEITSLVGQVQSVVDAAQFNGTNLLDGSTASLSILASLDRDAAGAVSTSSISLTTTNLNTSGAGSVRGGLAGSDGVTTNADNASFTVSAGVAGGEEIVIDDTNLQAGDTISITIGDQTASVVVSAADVADADTATVLASSLRDGIQALGIDGLILDATSTGGTIVFNNNGTGAVDRTITAEVTANDAGSLASLGGLNVSAGGDQTANIALVDAAINTVIDASAAIGTTQARVQIQADFQQTLIDNFNVGIGSLVDADLEEASARLQSLQVQQQLATQSLSIANQAPQSILALFR